jgi:hypothetical protein
MVRKKMDRKLGVVTVRSFVVVAVVVLVIVIVVFVVFVAVVTSMEKKK